MSQSPKMLTTTLALKDLWNSLAESVGERERGRERARERETGMRVILIIPFSSSALSNVSKTSCRLNESGKFCVGQAYQHKRPSFIHHQNGVGKGALAKTKPPPYFRARVICISDARTANNRPH